MDGESNLHKNSSQASPVYFIGKINAMKFSTSILGASGRANILAIRQICNTDVVQDGRRLSLFEFICFPPSLVIKQHPSHSHSCPFNENGYSDGNFYCGSFDDTVVISGNTPSWMNGA